MELENIVANTVLLKAREGKSAAPTANTTVGPRGGRPPTSAFAVCGNECALSQYYTCRDTHTHRECLVSGAGRDDRRPAGIYAGIC
uniref:Uncharacterized protein n=1 Tax=Cynoglossus semilaevis TaxID=244447 RepID=A0A3P8VQ19_CYNSE